MEEQNKIQEEQEVFNHLCKQKAFEIMPCEVNIDFDDSVRFEKLHLTAEQKMQVNELLQHVPTIAAMGEMAGAYTVKFPAGLPHTLMSLKQGGFGSQILNNGKIVGSASFHPMMGQAAVLGVFTAMSIATGQFFLVKINKELQMINKALDEIIKFLYRDKRAELLSELSFVKYARDNYTSIMLHEAHRIATISSIQEAKKIAMKDIEFFMNDLENQIDSIPKKNLTLDVLKKKMDNEVELDRENLDFSLQLYLMSSLMEIFYAQNYEKEYIENIKEGIKNYIKNCDGQERENSGALKVLLDTCKTPAKSVHELQKYKDNVASWSLEEKYSDVCEKLYNVLETSTQNAEYYLKTNGNNCDVYYKL